MNTGHYPNPVGIYAYGSYIWVLKLFLMMYLSWRQQKYIKVDKFL